MLYARGMNFRQFTRRDFLWSSALGGLASAVGVQAIGQSYPFTLGVASGSPTHDSVVLWTRLHGAHQTIFSQAQIAVQWEMAHDEAFKQLVQKGSATADAALGHSVHVEVQNLQADRWYFYRFMVGNAVSSVGRTRTFAKAGSMASQLRLAYASCQRWEAGYFTAYYHMLAEQPDAVLFLGDYIYEYPGNPVSAVRIPSSTSSFGFVLTLDDYRARYAQYKTDPDLQAMHAACPWLMTWDDHEVQNDYAGLIAGDSGAADVFSKPNEFPQRRAAAYQAYYENMPIRASSLVNGLAGLKGKKTGSELRIYQRVDVGQLASVYMLDTRQYRDRQACSKEGKFGASQINPDQCGHWLDPKRTLLGLQQEAWLDAQFAKAMQRGQTWNVLAQSTLFGLRDNKPGPEQSFFNDGWDGYPLARKKLTDSLQKHQVTNTVMLGGDVHENWVGYIKADYAQSPAAQRAKPIGVEFCGTSITSPAGSSAIARTAERLAENPHFVFADAASRGYGILDLTPKQLTTTLRIVDDARKPGTQVSTLAKFEVQAGQVVVERVA
ncbi:MAG TPA: alkaline phosphatase D family protein [Burkholderiaceae bacterium]|nr:alkaline phosphatase D family protein [Burkholderiaceae bacterium]